MTTTEVIRNGLEGVVAFTTEIAEPDRDGGALRYRGVDVEELVGSLAFEGRGGPPGRRPPRPPAAGGRPAAARLPHRRHPRRRAGGHRGARPGMGTPAA